MIDSYLTIIVHNHCDHKHCDNVVTYEGECCSRARICGYLFKIEFDNFRPEAADEDYIDLELSQLYDKLEAQGEFDD